jgi:hypothetical protein
MKQIILLALFTVLYTVRLGAQETQTKDTLSYKPFAEFNSDTVRFLEYNFMTRRKQYEGKKVSEVIKDMEFSVRHVANYVMRGHLLGGLALGIWQAGDKPDEGLDYYVLIYFKNAPLRDDFKKIFNIYEFYTNNKFTPELYDFIKDLEVSMLWANPYNPRVRKMFK